MRWSLVLAFLVSACGRLGFDASGGTDAMVDVAIDATTIVDCSTLPDGTTCDDRNVCTATASCQAGACVPDVPQTSCMLADSIDEFETTQGIKGWYYGFWRAETDLTYEGAVDFEAAIYDVDSYGSAQGEDFLYLTWWGTHTRIAPAVLTVRRWISDVQGPAVATVTVRKADINCGDGVEARLVVDDATAWQQVIAFDDNTGVVQPVPVELAPGTRVELLIGSGGSDACDTTNTSFTLASP